MIGFLRSSVGYVRSWKKHHRVIRYIFYFPGSIFVNISIEVPFRSILDTISLVSLLCLRFRIDFVFFEILKSAGEAGEFRLFEFWHDHKDGTRGLCQEKAAARIWPLLSWHISSVFGLFCQHTYLWTKKICEAHDGDGTLNQPGLVPFDFLDLVSAYLLRQEPRYKGWKLLSTD